MFINPFISVDQQLEDIGWIRQYEGSKGFIYGKRIGVGFFYVARYAKGWNGFYGIKFYDGEILHDYDAIPVNEKELVLFAKKIKEWKGQYENKDSI